MKRLVCFLLPFLFVLSCASAEPLDIVCLLYNNLAESLEYKQLPESYETIIKDDGTEERQYTFDDFAVTVYSANDNVYQFVVVCFSDDATADFLQQCRIATIALMMTGYNDEAMTVIENEYLRISAGLENDFVSVEHYAFNMRKVPYGLTFFVADMDYYRGK